ncbi:membrane protein [Christensenellaceae bacterium]|nr:membrane protein [Christensenellaceae bacterium]BDF61735.1 membrane protein [Christensenellaceae bacterium]
MAAFAPVLDVVTTCLNLVSVIILVWGVILSVKDYLVAHVRSRDKAERLVRLQDTKNSLGGYILLSLEILIVADIIDTIVKPTLEDIVRLAAIVAIRTVISYFLNKEIRESDMIKTHKGQ